MKPEDSYKILVEWVKYEHERMQHFNTLSMAVHSLIVTAIGYIVYNEGWQFPKILLIISVLGVLLALIWLLGLIRIRIEADIRFAQLRTLERIMEDEIKPEQKLFTEGYNFFFGGETIDELKEHKGKWKSFGFLNLYKVLAGGLLLAYLILLLIQLTVPCVE